jgi:hypothetical protein
VPLSHAGNGVAVIYLGQKQKAGLLALQARFPPSDFGDLSDAASLGDNPERFPLVLAE